MSAVTLATLSLFASGCGNDSPPTGLASQPGKGHIDPGDRCATPNAGCECGEPDAVVECGKVQREVAGQTWCSVGHRACGADGIWGECEVEGVRLISDLEVGQQEQGLGTPTACATNKCDPFCQQVSDTGTDTPLPDGLQQTPEGGITLVPKDATIEDAPCTGIEVTPTPQVLTVTSLKGKVTQTGLEGEYFNEAFPDEKPPAAIPADWKPDATVIDPQVSFNWTDAPRAGFGTDYFMVRWTGWLRPSTTGEYQLCTRGDDGVRLWLGSSTTPIVDDWSLHGARPVCSAKMTLKADTFYQIRMEMFDNEGYGVAELRWKHAAVTDPDGELIPNQNLHPPAVVDEINGLVVTPRFAQFSVRGIPAGCFEGPLRAAWSLDRLDRALIDEQGKVSLFAPIAGDITVTAYVGPFQAKGTVRVKVDVRDTSAAPSGASDALDQPPKGTDPMTTVLYPYVDTVFPLGLRSPTIQWDNGDKAGTAVMISLTSPATGTPVFSWKKILPDASPGRYVVPQEIWSLLEATAKGKTAAYSVQRVADGAARPAVVRPISFASAPVRGKIYYTQYRRSPDIASLMVADPGSTDVAKSAFSNDGGGCPVCHSVSANGAVFATSDRSFGSNGGLSKIESDGSFTPLSDYTSTVSPYRDGREDWRGFAWAPLTPDGKYALAANNIWGNSKQAVVGINEGSRTVSVPGTFLSGGSGTGLLARYYMNSTETGWEWRRTDPTVNFDWSNGSPGGPVTEKFSVAWSGQVQAYTTESYTFEIRTSGGVQLLVDNQSVINELANATTRTFTGTVALQRGRKTPIALSFRDNGTNAAVILRWSSPSVTRQIVPQSQLYPNDGWHGVLATYYENDDFTTPFITERLESQLAADWGAGGPAPMPRGDNEYWSAVFTGQLQAPADGNLKVCVNADDDVVVSVDGVERIRASNVTGQCSTAFAVTRDRKYPLTVTFKEKTGDAKLELRWSMEGVFAEETVPSERLSPPAAWTPPGTGLTVTYYDNDDFNASLGAGSVTSATTRIEPNADLDWAYQRPEFSSAVTRSDYWSSRFTGRLVVTCGGVYEFEVRGDDVAQLWVDEQRVVSVPSFGTRQGALWLSTGPHDLKLDHVQHGGASELHLRWKADCLNHTAFVPIPNASLVPSGDRGTGGFVLSGGDNGNESGYFVWQTPTNAGAASVDVTADTPGRWGLGNSVMMVPSFAPDGSKLVFIDGDSAGGNGWRKGLSTFDFDQANKVFKNRKTILSTWPQGDVMKWPVFESDSRSVIFQRTVPADMCCRANWTKYGYMAPTNYYEDPGRLYSVDTQSANPTAVELVKLNRGERAWDRNKAYQVTMLPQATGGYRWAVFTSTRPYGNTLNLQGQQDFSNTASYTPISEYSKLQSMLWVAAVDDTPSAGADRSHPAFFLPNQNYVETAASGFINERAFWVTEACRQPGTSSTSACDVDEDCCGGATGKAVCRIDTPISIPPTRHCFQVPDTCVATGNTCASSAECCKGTVCDDGVCIKPPGFVKFVPANYQRVYESNCGQGQKPDWTFFELKASVPAVGGLIEVYAESSDSPTGFKKLPAYPSAVSLPGVARLGTLNAPATPADWIVFPMDEALKDAGVVERKFLSITLRLVPNTGGTTAPVVMELRQSFSCPSGE